MTTYNTRHTCIVCKRKLSWDMEEIPLLLSAGSSSSWICRWGTCRNDYYKKLRNDLTEKLTLLNSICPESVKD